MLSTTPEFKRVVQAPSQEAVVYVDIEQDGQVKRRVYPSEGSVEVQKYNAIRRTCTFRVPGTPDLVPAGLGDVLSIGSVARPYRGVVKPSVTRVTATFRNEAEWETGTFTGTVVNDDGQLTL